MTPAPLNRVARRVRAVPGYPVARRRAIKTLRRSRTARELVKRVFDVEDGSGWSPPTDVASGRLVGGVGTESLPVVLVVMIGTPRDIAEQSIETIARLQLLGAGFRPVILLDRPMFGSIRQHGYPAELVPSEASWPSDADWSEHVRERIRLAMSTYRCSASLNIGEHGLDRSGELLLSALRPDRR